MGEYFHGWRRKVGVVTLVMACMFVAGWLRSLENVEFFYLNLWQVRNAIISVDGNLCVFRASRISMLESGFVWVTLPIVSVYGVDETGSLRPVDANTIFNINHGNGNDFLWRWQFFGFNCGMVSSVSAPTCPTPFVIIPYWSVTIPLTLISFWLLLSKHRKSTSVNLIEPAAERMA